MPSTACSWFLHKKLYVTQQFKFGWLFMLKCVCDVTLYLWGHCDSLSEPPTVFRHSGEVVTFNLYSMTPTQWARASLELTKHTHTYIGTMSKRKSRTVNIHSIGLNDCILKLCFCFLLHQVSRLHNYPYDALSSIKKTKDQLWEMREEFRIRLSEDCSVTKPC